MTRTVASPFLTGLALALLSLALSPGPAVAQDTTAGAWHLPDLVDAVASFGAVAHDGALYVYGGHVGRTHVHSMANISPGFRRLVVEPGRTWEELARGPLLQGAVLVSGGSAIVVSASGRIEGFDAGTGERTWFFEDLQGNHVPSPTVTEDLVIVGGLAVQANLAVRRGRTGGLGRRDVVWAAGSASNFASPFAYRECVYWVNPAGVARCLALASGAVRWTHRLPASTWATPLGHEDHVYFFTQDGVTQVLRASADAPEVIATNHLSVDAPVTGFAVVDDAIVIRAGSEVMRVGRTMD